MLKSRLLEIAANIKAESNAVVERTARRIADDAAAFAPVDKGDLKRSYEKPEAVEMTGHAEATVGSDEPHSIFQEYGGAKFSANPHLVPAAAQNVETFKRDALEMCREAAK